MNDTTTDQYSELMHRYELIHADWMRRVDAVRDMPIDQHFMSHGVVLGPNGQLRIQARALEGQGGAALWELSMMPGDTQVRITFPSGDTYLV